MTTAELKNGVLAEGLQFLVNNFKLQTIVPEYNTITHYFEGGLRLVSKGGGCSGEDFLDTTLYNAEGETIAVW
ncbi:hypothetical protein MA9V2_158 [Chryseobacterium phage MA9V-2]|nr:hypothetical protein MA9V2_158 [Chryseobacterium phage MA9V-2]